MRVLTSDNTVYNLDMMPDELEEDVRFCVLDYGGTVEPDYYFQSLLFMEMFDAPAVVLQVGEYTFKVPIDWNLVVSESSIGDPEIIPVTSLNNRGFSAFSINPISSFMPSYPLVKVVNVYSDVRWHTPKMKQGQILVVPVSEKPESECVLLVKDTTRIPEILSITDLQ